MPCLVDLTKLNFELKEKSKESDFSTEEKIFRKVQKNEAELHSM